MNKFRPISISLSPNVEKDDIKLALNLLIRPWLWKNGRGIKELQESFEKFLGIRYAISFNSGRSAFYAILKALNLEKGSEVAVQAFTCNAVPNPVLWNDLVPVYIDCNIEDYNISLDDLKAKISPKTKVVVVQHTFGLPAQIEKIKEFCDERKIILIEDCAHALGAEYMTYKVGTFGEASFFSFSRDKVISSVYGGMVATNNEKLAKKIKKIQEEFGKPSLLWILQQILHPILLQFFVLPIYSLFNVGKIILIFFQVSHILSKAVSWKEKRGLRPDYFPKSLPNALAIMAMNQLSKVDKFNNHRQNVAHYYKKELEGTEFKLPANFEDRKNIYLRFPVRHKKAHEIIFDSWHDKNMLLGDWYTTPIAPFDTKIEELKYTKGSCANAEWLSKQTLNLPTHINITQKEAEKVVTFLKSYAKRKK